MIRCITRVSSKKYAGICRIYSQLFPGFFFAYQEVGYKHCKAKMRNWREQSASLTPPTKCFLSCPNGLNYLLMHKYMDEAHRLVGVVGSGKGDAQTWLRTFEPAYKRKLGWSPFPGSLNIHLQVPLFLSFFEFLSHVAERDANETSIAYPFFLPILNESYINRGQHSPKILNIHEQSRVRR